MNEVTPSIDSHSKNGRNMSTTNPIRIRIEKAGFVILLDHAKLNKLKLWKSKVRNLSINVLLSIFVKIINEGKKIRREKKKTT